MAFNDLVSFDPDENKTDEPGGLIALGEFRFGVDTIPYSAIEQTTKFKWREQGRIGNDPKLQFLGTEAKKVTLNGVFFPSLRGGYEQMPALIEQADKGEPLAMVDSRGNSLGLWVVEEVGERLTHLYADGLPRKNQFRIQIKRYER